MRVSLTSLAYNRLRAINLGEYLPRLTSQCQPLERGKCPHLAQ